MSLDSLYQLVSDDFSAVNDLIIAKLSEDVGLVEELSQHILSSGGKRLRPLLVLLSAKACDYSGSNHIQCAAAVEYFHTATLLHDDVLDESSLRRGVETANEIWGSKASILVGDYLLTQSIQLMVEVDCMQALAVLTDAAHQITCGEVKQLANVGKEQVTIEEYFDVIRSKTALLFAASSEIAAQLAKQTTPVRQAMRAYGLHLGNAFQIIDDILDYTVDSNKTGKNQGDDLCDGKVTLPLIYALEKATTEQAALIKSSLGQSDARDKLPEIQHILHQHGALDACYATAETEIDQALSALTAIPDSVYKQALVTLAQFSINRSH